MNRQSKPPLQLRPLGTLLRSRRGGPVVRLEVDEAAVFVAGFALVGGFDEDFEVEGGGEGDSWEEYGERGRVRGKGGFCLVIVRGDLEEGGGAYDGE